MLIYVNIAQELRAIAKKNQPPPPEFNEAKVQETVNYLIELARKEAEKGKYVLHYVPLNSGPDYEEALKRLQAEGFFHMRCSQFHYEQGWGDALYWTEHDLYTNQTIIKNENNR